MNIESILIQLVCFSCAVLLLRARTLQRGWVIVAGSLLLVVGGLVWWAPAQAAWVSVSLWFGLILVPLYGFARVNRLVTQERYRAARHLVTWLRWFHPLDGWLEYPDVLRSLELGQQGDIDAAIAWLTQQQTLNQATVRTVTIMLYRMGARWPAIIDWVHANLTGMERFRSTEVGVIYLRSLGEMGRLNELLEELERFEQKLDPGDTTTLRLIRLYALAFCGQVHPVQDACQSGSLATYPNQIRQFWVATAEMAAGHDVLARQRLLELRQVADINQRRAIDWRLAQPAIDLDHILTTASRQIIIRLRTETQQENQYSLFSKLPQSTTTATKVLLLLNVLIFGVQSLIWLRFGDMGADLALMQLAMIPGLTVTGQWWRVITANFLHINLFHLLMNMAGLWFLGQWVETTWGTSRFLLVYAISGIGAMLTVALVAIATHAQPLVVVGASGAIMGLLGVVCAILLRGWQQHHARMAGRQLQFIFTIIALQVMFDLLNPETSMVGHISGLILGFIAGYMLSMVRSHQKPIRP